MNNEIHDIMTRWMDSHGVNSGKKRDDLPNRDKYEDNLKNLKPQRELDLHGMTAEQALTALEQFVDNCKRDHIKKILIIHGKGLHSSNGPVLKKVIIDFLEKSSKIGRIGRPGRNDGGSGAVWALVR